MKVPKAVHAAALCAALFSKLASVFAEVNEVEKVAPGVYFHEGDLSGRGHCNNGWVIFRDYVLVIDANFPSGAQDIIPKIRALTDKPIRFAFDTHHHGDHLYGNQVWVENGAVPVAHLGVIDELKKYETGYYGGQPGRWEDTARNRTDVAASKLAPPTLLYRTDMIFDDGEQRVELLHFGVAHTHGDGFAWLPKERILFTGDAAVNGAYNYIGDGDTAKWIETLEAAKKLGAAIICPGHGPKGGREILEDQQAFFVELRDQVSSIKDKSPDEVQAAVEHIKAALGKQPRIARYVGGSISAQVEKVYIEMGGKAFRSAAVKKETHDQHARDHGHTHIQPGSSSGGE